MGEAMGCVAACAAAELVSQRELETGVPPSPQMLEQSNLALLAQGRKLSAMDLVQARKKINTVSRPFAAYFESHDVWLTPTMGDVGAAARLSRFELPRCRTADEAFLRTLSLQFDL